MEIGTRVREKATDRVGVIKRPCNGGVGGCWQVRFEGERADRHRYDWNLEEVKQVNTRTQVEQALNEARRLVALWQLEADRRERELADLPPFEKGQKVRVREKGSAFYVDDVAQAFGGWVVLGYFPNGSKKYTYPATELEEY